MSWIVSLMIIAFPVSEAILIFHVARNVGILNTIFLLIFVAVLGVYLAKMQGYAVLLKMQACVREGQLPTHQMTDGLLIFLSGILFVFPGFISDALALVLLFPLTRWLIRSLLLTGVKSDQQRRSQKEGKASFSSQQQQSNFNRSNVEDAQIVE